MVFKEGDESDGLYIIDDGTIKGWARDKKLRYKRLKTEMVQGSVIGEISFYLNSMRSASL